MEQALHYQQAGYTNEYQHSHAPVGLAVHFRQQVGSRYVQRYTAGKWQSVFELAL
jgi:hypothetical protein